jgi:hypothetical protein
MRMLKKRWAAADLPWESPGKGEPPPWNERPRRPAAQHTAPQRCRRVRVRVRGGGRFLFEWGPNGRALQVAPYIRRRFLMRGMRNLARRRMARWICSRQRRRRDAGAPGTTRLRGRAASWQPGCLVPARKKITLWMPDVSGYYPYPNPNSFFLIEFGCFHFAIHFQFEYEYEFHICVLNEYEFG